LEKKARAKHAKTEFAQGPVTAALKKDQPTSQPASHTPETKHPLIQGPPVLPSPVFLFLFVFVFGFSVARGVLGDLGIWGAGYSPPVCGYLHDICSYNKPQELLKQQQ